MDEVSFADPTTWESYLNEIKDSAIQVISLVSFLGICNREHPSWMKAGEKLDKGLKKFAKLLNDNKPMTPDQYWEEPNSRVAAVLTLASSPADPVYDVMYEVLGIGADAMTSIAFNGVDAKIPDVDDDAFFPSIRSQIARAKTQPGSASIIAPSISIDRNNDPSSAPIRRDSNLEDIVDVGSDETWTKFESLEKQPDTTEPTELPSRKGRLLKAESEAKRAQTLALLSGHPTMVDSPGLVADQVGISESTARRWIDGFREENTRRK